MWTPELFENDTRARTAVLTRQAGRSSVTVHDTDGHLIAGRVYESLVSPPQAAEEIRGYGYVVSWWEPVESGMYWATVTVPPEASFKDQGGWQKEAGVPPARLWALGPEEQRKSEAITVRLNEEWRLKSIEARKKFREPLEVGRVYATVRRG